MTTSADSPLFFFDELPADGQAATRRFEERYVMSIGAKPPSKWTDAGDMIPTDAPMLTFPINAFASQYERFTGEDNFKSLENKSFDVKPEQFQAGHQAELLEITKIPWKYKQWLQGTQRFMVAEANLRAKTIAKLLDNGENTKWGTGDGIDGANFFSATHLSDITNPKSKKWSNYQSVAKSPTVIADLQGEVSAFQSNILDENGEVVDADPDTIYASTARYEPIRSFIAQEYISATNNPYYKRFNVVKIPQLGNDLDWYLADSKMIAETGLPPWLWLRMTVAAQLGLRFFDESSDFFKRTGKIRVSSHVWCAGALAFPHGIRKVKGTALS